MSKPTHPTGNSVPPQAQTTRPATLDATQTSPPSAVAPQTTVQVPGAIQRVYAGSQVLDHDLYKLLPENAIRNVSWNDEPDLHEIPHVHFFHSIDSDGRAQVHSTAACGHFHVMEVTRDASNPGAPPTVACVSGPVTYVRKRVRGKSVKLIEPVKPADDPAFDAHRHEIKYIRSERIQMRAINTYATNLVAADANKTAPLPGVVGAGSR